MLLIYINGIPCVIGNVVTSTDLYADDTTVCYFHSNIQTKEINVQKSLVFLKDMCGNSNAHYFCVRKTKRFFLLSFGDLRILINTVFRYPYVRLMSDIFLTK